MASGRRTPPKAAKRVATRQPWEPMKLTYSGDVGKIIQGGGGKLSLTGGDPGESRKERGGGR